MLAMGSLIIGSMLVILLLVGITVVPLIAISIIAAIRIFLSVRERKTKSFDLNSGG